MITGRVQRMSDTDQPVTIRPYRASDLEACQRIAGSSRDYAHAIDANADVVEVATIADKVVGYAYIQVWDWNRVAWLGDVLIATEHRNRGIGAMLLRRMEECARERNCRVLMDHPPANHPAVAYYLKYGFRICGYNDTFYASDGDKTALFLSRDLE